MFIGWTEGPAQPAQDAEPEELEVRLWNVRLATRQRLSWLHTAALEAAPDPKSWARSLRWTIAGTATSLQVTGGDLTRRQMRELSELGATCDQTLINWSGHSTGVGIDFALTFDDRGLARGEIKTREEVELPPLRLLTVQPLAVVRTAGAKVPPGKTLARWPRPDALAGWEFFEASGEVGVTLQAASLSEPLYEAPPSSSPAQYATRLGAPTELVVDVTAEEGESRSEHRANHLRAFGARGDRPCGVELKSVVIEPMAGLRFSVTAPPGTTLSELAGLIGDPVVISDPREARLAETDRALAMQLSRTAVYQPWLLSPRDISVLQARVEVEVGKLGTDGLWGDVMHAIPPEYHARFSKHSSGNGEIAELAIATLGTHGRFKSSFNDGEFKISATILGGRLLHYKIEIVQQVNCYSHVVDYVVEYVRRLGAGPAYLTRVKREVRATQRHRDQAAGVLDALVLEPRYECGEPRVVGNYWVLDLHAKDARSAEGVALLAAPGKHPTPYGERPREEVGSACKLQHLSCKGALDPDLSAATDEWPLLPGYDIPLPDSGSYPVVICEDDVLVDLGCGTGALLPVSARGLRLKLMRGQLVEDPEAATPTVNAADEVIRRIQLTREEVVCALSVDDGSGCAPDDSLFRALRIDPDSVRWPGGVPEEVREWRAFLRSGAPPPAVQALVQLLEAESDPDLEQLLRGLEQATEQTEQTSRWLREFLAKVAVYIEEGRLSTGAARTVLRRRLALPWGLLSEWVSAMEEEPPWLTALVSRHAMQLAPFPAQGWDARRTALTNRIRTAEQEVRTLVSATEADLDRLVSPFGLDRLAKLAGFEASSLSDLVLDASASSRTLLATIQDEVEKPIAFAIAELGRGSEAFRIATILGETTRLWTATPERLPALLAVAPQGVGAGEIEFAKPTDRPGPKTVPLEWAVGRLEGGALARHAASALAGARVLDGALNLKELANGKVEATLSNLAHALPFEGLNGAILPLILQPAFDPVTRKATLIGRGELKGLALRMPGDLLHFEEARLSYRAVAEAREGQGLKFALELELRGKLVVLPEIPSASVSISDFGMILDERGGIRIDLDPAKIELASRDG